MVLSVTLSLTSILHQRLPLPECIPPKVREMLPTFSEGCSTFLTMKCGIPSMIMVQNSISILVSQFLNLVLVNTGLVSAHQQTIQCVNDSIAPFEMNSLTLDT